MSSDIFLFDELSYCHHSTSNMLSPEAAACDLQFFSDSSIDNILQEICNDPSINTNRNTITTQNSSNNTHQLSVDEAQSLEQIAQTLLSNSPPSHQMENLSLCQQTHLANLPNASDLANGYSDYSVSEMKTEDSQLGFDSSGYNSYLFGRNGFGGENMIGFLQRSYSSNSFDGKQEGFPFQPGFDPLLESPAFQAITSPESSFSCGQMRRVCSTGDLPMVIKRSQTSSQRLLPSSPLGNEGTLMEEANFKVGKYSAEERKERIDRYRAKRTQRNFNKTIKYACRKTLADNRPRIRGRFARNDEMGDISKTSCSTKYEDEEDPWMDSMHEEDEEAIAAGRRGPFLTNFGQRQPLHYSGY
ncbi:hypothetical protein Ancab_032697 [Ancistrocladus abbreviatus]